MKYPGKMILKIYKKIVYMLVRRNNLLKCIWHKSLWTNSKSELTSIWQQKTRLIYLLDKNLHITER